MPDQKAPKQRVRTKEFSKRNWRRDFFLYQSRIINREEAKNIIRELIYRGMPHHKIKAELGLEARNFSTTYLKLVKEITVDQQTITPDPLRYAIVSEHPFPRDLADEQIMERLQGPWLHACHLDDTGIGEIQKRVEEMGNAYGWVRIVKLVPIDQQTLVDNHGVLI